MPMRIEGVVRGGRIETIGGPDLVEGQRVQVVIDPGNAPPASPTIDPTPEEGVVLTPAPPDLLELLGRIRRTRPPLPPSPTGPGRNTAAGMLADSPDFDAVMAEIERDRRADHGRDLTE